MKKDEKTKAENLDIPERRKAEEALRESEPKYRSMVEQSLLGVLIVQDGHLAYVNRMIEEKGGYSLSELSAMSQEQLKDLIHPDDRDIVWNRMMNRLRGKTEPERNECRFIAKDGTTYWTDAHVSVIEYLSRPAIQMIFVDITERKKTEEALRESEEKFKALAEYSSDAIIRFNREHRHLYVNPAAEALFGIKPDEFIGKTHRELGFPEHLVKTWEAFIDQVFKTAKPYNICLQLPNEIWIDWLLMPEFSRDKSVSAVITSARDITERKRAEDELQESEEWHKALVETSGRAGIGIVVLQSIEGREAAIVSVNSKTCEISGYSREELLDMSLEEVIPIELLGQIMAKYKERQQGEPVPNAYEIAFMRKDKAIVPIVAGVALMQLYGKPATAVFMRDITEQKQAEEALRQSEEKFKALAEYSSDTIMRFDSNHRHLYVNPVVEAQTGIKAEVFIGKTHRELGFPEYLVKIWEEAIDRVFTTAEPYNIEFELPIGIWVDWRLTPEFSDDGRVSAVITAGRDITERKLAEDALRASEEQYRLMFESSVDGKAIVDIETTKILLANETALKIYGFGSKAELEGVNLFDYIHPDDRVRVVAAAQDNIMFNRGMTTLEEVRTLTKNGEEKWILVTGTLGEYEGRPVGLTSFVDITERKKAEEALRASEEKYRKVIDNANECIAVLQDGVTKFANNKFSEIFGYSSEEYLLKPFMDFIHPDDKQMVADRYVRRLKGENVPNTYQLRIINKAGDMVWAQLNGTLMQWEGNPATLALFNDITEQKRAEEALRANEERFRTLIEKSADVIVIMDIVGKISYVSPSLETVTGYKVEDWVSTSIEQWMSVMEGNDMVQLASLLADVLRNPDKVFEGVTVLFKYKDGSWHYIEATVRNLLNDPKVNGLAINYHDITERKQAEEALRAEQRLFSTITNSAQDAIIMLDPDGKISFWNPAAERIFGYSYQEAVGQHMHTFLSPERYRAAYNDAYPHFRETGEGKAVGNTLELAAIRKDGAEFPIELSMSAIKQKGSWHAVGIARDITERKRSEDALRQMNAMLEQQTVIANEMASRAEMANTAKSDFLANMSHEIRTPLNGVIGMTGLLLDTDLTEEQRRYADIVRSSGESLLGLINDILDFSKIEARKFELETLDFDLLSLLDDLAATLTLRAQDKGLELLYGCDPDVTSLLRGDPGRLRQVLTNLVGNAIKFTFKGEVSVRISVDSQTYDAAMLRFTIRDTGIGIPADKIGLLFDKFVQADASTTRRYGGTGLGLAISKQLVELMGGQIGVASEEGKGSEFWFTAHFEKQPEANMSETPMPADLQNIHVLIVDDNATSREIITAYVSSWGMRPKGADDSPAALKALYRELDNNDPFRIVLMDKQMPGMDGEALGRAIRSDPRLSETRMIILTSMGIRGDAKRYADIGFAGYMTKPVLQRELKGVLSLALAERDTAEGSPRPIATRHAARETMPSMQDCKARILLAEDNITNQQVALSILKKMGLSADAVANGREVLQALDSIPYDLVLMDCQMPVMDGYEATREIRNPQSAVRNHQIPIISMTAHALQGDREKCIDAGMNDYLPKPVSPQALAEMLRKWLPEDEAMSTKGKTEEGKQTTTDARVGEPPVWDREGMLERLMGDEDLLSTIKEAFLTDIPNQIQTLKGMIEAGEISAAGVQAHAIKGASANVGGERLRALAFEMEKAAKEGNSDAVRERIGDLDKEFERLKQAMQET